MNSVWLGLAIAMLGSDYGWQRTDSGEMEYIIQIEPELLAAMQSGREIVSELPAQLQTVRRIRVRVGKGALPREGLQQTRPGRTGFSIQDVPPPPGAGVAPGGGGIVPPNPRLDMGPPPGNPPAFPTGAANDPRNEPAPVGSGVVGGGFPANPGGTDAGASQFVPKFDPPPVGNSGAEPPSLYSPRTNAPDNGGGFVPPVTAPAGNPNDFAPPSLPIHDASGAAVDNPASPIPANNGQLRPIPQIPGEGTRPNPLPASPAVAFSPIQTDPQVAAVTTPAEASQRTDVAARQPAVTDTNKSENATKPWLPLLLTSFALFASIAANIYLGWIAIGSYQRYTQLVREVNQEPGRGAVGTAA